MLGIREKNMSIPKKKVDKKFRRIEVKYCVKYFSFKLSYYNEYKSYSSHVYDDNKVLKIN